jgi:hypothetical protein
MSEQVRIEPAVMASEIERLRDLEGFLKFASIPDWRRVGLAVPRASAEQRRKRASVAATAAG